MKISALLPVITIALFAAVLLSSCVEADEADTSPVIAKVGNSSLTLNEAFHQIPGHVLVQDTIAAVSAYKEQWIQTKLKINEAERQQVWNTPGFQERYERLRLQLMENMLTEYILKQNKDQLVVTRDEAQNYFQAHKDKFVLDERYIRFRHIKTSTRAAAENARRDIMRGINWSTVVESYSIQPELKFRESTQFWPVSLAAADIPMLNRYLNVIGITEISPIYHYRGQFHFVQLMEERNQGDHPDFDWLIPQIEEWLRLEKSQRITKAFIRNLYLQAESNNEISQMSKDDIRGYLQKSETEIQ